VSEQSPTPKTLAFLQSVVASKEARRQVDFPRGDAGTCLLRFATCVSKSRVPRTPCTASCTVSNEMTVEEDDSKEISSSNSGTTIE
jgi:hypothetical protein